MYNLTHCAGKNETIKLIGCSPSVKVKIVNIMESFTLSKQQ